MSLDDRFEKAADMVNFLKASPSIEEMKEIYALYKQSTVGDINIECPLDDPERQIRWKAWSTKKGITQNEAKEQYIKIMDDMGKKYGLRF